MDKLKRIIIFCLLFLLLISFHQNSILDADHHNFHPSPSYSSSSSSPSSSSAYSISSVSAVSTFPRRKIEESTTKSNNVETRSRTGEKVPETNSMEKVLRTRFLKGENVDSIPSFSTLLSSSITTKEEQETEKRGIKEEGKKEEKEGKMFERVENVVIPSLKSISKSNESFLLKNVTVTEQVLKEEPLKVSRTEPELVSKTTSTLHEQEKKTNGSLGIKIMERKYPLPQDPFLYSSIPSSSSSILTSSGSNNSLSLPSSSIPGSSFPLEVISKESRKGRVELNRNHVLDPIMNRNHHVLEPIVNRLFDHEKIFLSNQYFQNQELERDEEEEKKKNGEIFGLIDTGRKNVVEKNVIGKKTLNPSITSFPLHVIFDPITFNGIKNGAKRNIEERERRTEEKVKENMEEKKVETMKEKIQENVEERERMEEKKKEERKEEKNISVTSASIGKKETIGVNGVGNRRIPSSSSFSSSSFLSRTESSTKKDGRGKITIKEKGAENSFGGEEKKEKESSIVSASSIPILSSSSLSSSFPPSTSSSGNHVRNNQQMLIQNDAFTRMGEKVLGQERKELVLEQGRRVLELEHKREKGKNGNEYNSNKEKEERRRLDQQERKGEENDEQTNQKQEEKKEKEGDERRRHTNDGNKIKNQKENTANMEMNGGKIIQAVGERSDGREEERKLKEGEEKKLEEKGGNLEEEKNEPSRYRNGNESFLSQPSSFSSPSSSSFLPKPSSPSLSPSTLSIFPALSSSLPSSPGSKDRRNDDRKKDEEKDGANRTKVSTDGGSRTKDEDDDKRKKSMNDSTVIYDRKRMRMTGDGDRKDGRTMGEKEKERVKAREEGERRKKVEYSEILSVDHMLQYLTFSTCLVLLFMTLFAQFQSVLPLEHPRTSVKESRKKEGKKEKEKEGKNHGMNEYCNWIPLSIKSLISGTESEHVPKRESGDVPRIESEDVPRRESEHVPKRESIGLNERQFISINFLLSFILIQFLFFLNGFPSLQSSFSPSFPSPSSFSSPSITPNGQHLDHDTKVLMSIQNVLMSNQKDKVLMSSSIINPGSKIDDINFGSEKISQSKEIREQSSEGESSVRKGSDTEISDEGKVISDGCHSMVYLIHFLHLSCCFWLLSHSIHLYQITVLANVSKSPKVSKSSRPSRHHCRTPYHHSRTFRNIVNWIKHFSSSFFSLSRIVSNVSKNNDLSHAKKFDTKCVQV